MLILNVTLCQQSADMRCDINLFKFGRRQLVNILDTVISSENISDTSFDHKMYKENLKYEGSDFKWKDNKHKKKLTWKKTIIVIFYPDCVQREP